MTPKISVFIPVYRESETLEPLLADLLADPYEDKEVFAVVDEPTPRSLSIAKKFAGKVRFIWNDQRKGKVNVLNEVVKLSTGEILLFLDADLRVERNSRDFLKVISEGMKEAELIEIKKGIIRDSFLARIVSYDYLSFSFTNWFFSHRLKKCLGLNGAAFAIKKEIFETLGGFRKVVCEDLDMGTRSFIKGVRFKFLANIGVSTRAPSSWSQWFKQRKRWGIGTASWFKEYIRDLSKIARNHPGVLLPSLLFIFPALPLLIVNLFMPDELYVKMLYVGLLLLSTQTSLLLPPTALTSTTLSILKNLFIMIISLGTYTSIFYLFAKKMGFPFNPLEFAVFYLVYSPFWLLIIIASITRIYVKSRQTNIDWKI